MTQLSSGPEADRLSPTAATEGSKVISKVPRVSIITPSYRQAVFLEDTILSVLNQAYPQVEYIVVDGGSADGSVDIIKKYADKLAYWVSEPDHGQSHAINKGLARATGEVVAWLNSDDVYCPGALSTAMQYFADHPDVGLLYGNSEYIDAQGHHLGYYPTRIFSHTSLFGTATGGVSNYIPQPSVFVRMAALRRTNLVDEHLTFALDFDLWGQLSRQCKFASISPVLSRYRITPSAKTSALRLRGAAEIAVVLHRYGSRSARLRSLTYYFGLAAQQGVLPGKAVSELTKVFSTCGLLLGKSAGQREWLLALARAGKLINSLFPVWHTYMRFSHRIASRLRRRRQNEDVLFYYDSIPMQRSPSDLDQEH